MTPGTFLLWCLAIAGAVWALAAAALAAWLIYAVLTTVDRDV